MSWIDRIKAWRKGHDNASAQVVPSLRPDQWTIPGITFDTSGWQLLDASPTAMSWSAPDATLTLTRDNVPDDYAAMALNVVRDLQRQRARANGEDIVLVEVVNLIGGKALECIFKRRHGTGHAYRGLMEIHQGADRFQISSDTNEGGMTGTREAMVSAMRVSCGEFALGRQNEDGSYQILGWLHDAYDPAFDDGAMNSVSDDERLDPLLPNHPLTRTRALFRSVASSLRLGGNEAGRAGVLLEDADSLPLSGPRRQLSSKVARALFNAAGRDDLFEQSLNDEIASLGETSSPELAACLLQQGIFLQMRDRPGNALPILSRAERMLVSFAGEEALPTAVARTHRAHALLKIGQRSQALPLFLRAVQVLEATQGDDGNYALALSGACQLLAEQGREDLARQYLERLQKVMTRISPESPH